MKVVCHREGLLSASQIASLAAAARDVKPVLRNLKAVVESDRCILMATDLELGVRIEVRGVQVIEPGEALLPAGRLSAILRESTDEELTIDASPDRCLIQGQANEFELPGEDPSTFPDIPSFAEEVYHEVAAGVLRDMIRRTIFAVATAEHTKFGATTGILWDLHEDEASLVATDGRRLALAKGQVKAQGGQSTRTQMPVVPPKAVSLLERNLSEPEETIRIAFRPNEVLMKTERAMVYSRLVEGRFPNYQQVLPQKLPIKIPLTVGPFQAAIRQAAVMTDEESKRVTFHFEKNTLTLQARGTETGRSKVQLPVEYKGDAFEISFDPKFILDMLRIQEPDTQFTMEMNQPNTPALFRVSPEYQYVVVPLVVPGK